MTGNIILRWTQLQSIVGLSRSTVFRLEKQGSFPKRIQLSRKAVGWKLDEITEWLESRDVVEKSSPDSQDDQGGLK